MYVNGFYKRQAGILQPLPRFLLFKSTKPYKTLFQRTDLQVFGGVNLIFENSNSRFTAITIL